MDQQVATHTAEHPVVMLALARHDGPYSSTAWSLAQAFAVQGKVLYIDNPFTLTDFFKKSKGLQILKRYTSWGRRKRQLFLPDKKQHNLLVMVPPLMLPVNWLPAGRLYTFFSGINRWLLKRSLDKALQKAGIENFVFINSFNPFYGAKPPCSQKPFRYIYQTVDAIAESKYIGKHGPRLEKKAMQEADVCVATSITLSREAARWNRKSVCIPNAADTRLFRQAMEKKLTQPEELQGEQRSVVCYTGHIDHRLDYQILLTSARQHSDTLFLLIGPVSGTEWERSGLASLPNVLFTGKKALHELPAYLQYAQAALIPFKCNALTASIYPLKLNEYLAAGKAVVATPFSEDIRAFKQAISLAEQPAAFADALGEALKSDTPQEREKRLKVAEENTWEVRVAAFRALFAPERQESLIKKDNPSYEEAVK